MAKRYEDRYGRGGQRRDRDHAHDRGYMDRATDEVRSWFGDEDADRRRHMDEERDHAPGRHRDDWDRADRGEWNRPQANRMTGRGDWRASEWPRPHDHDSDRSRWDRTSSSAWRGESAPYGSGYADRGDQSRSSDWQWSDRQRDVSTRNPYGTMSERDVAPGGRDWSVRDRDRTWEHDRNWGTDSPQRVTSHDWRHAGDVYRSSDDDRHRTGSRFWGRGPKGYQRNDSRIQEDVCERLTFSEVNAEGIEVTVANGEVTLTGVVSERWDKRRAEDIADDVSGVREVHNNIRVQRDDERSGGVRSERPSSMRDDRGIGMSDTTDSPQPGAVLGVNPTSGAHLTNSPPANPTGSTSRNRS